LRERRGESTAPESRRGPNASRPAAAADARPAPFRSALLLLFAGSGCAALLYEVIWFHLLRLAVGCSSISMAFLLGSFMGGMCLGTLLLPRLIGPDRHPLRVYAALEVGIGALGVALTAALPWIGGVYAAHAGDGLRGLVLRGAVCGATLLLPTMLMGATLPAIGRWLDTSADGVRGLGLFYAANIAGAVAGALLAGFVLLPWYDVVVATWVAAAINALVALGALAIGRREPRARAAPVATPSAATAVEPAARRTAVHVAIALSGCTALGAEVVWTRLLSLLFGATVYTFTLILAVFLVGLGLGSWSGSRWLARPTPPRSLLFRCQLLLVPSFVYSAFAITSVIPYGEPTWIFPRSVYQNMWLHYAWDVLRCALAIGPATVLWGASFPLAVAAARSRDDDAGRLVAGTYAANTIGAIAGALGVGLFAIGGLGSQRTEQLLAVLAGVAAALLLPGSAPGVRMARQLPAVAALTAVCAALIAPVPDPMIAFGRAIVGWKSSHRYLFTAEGVNSSIAITEIGGNRYFHVNGRVEASTELNDMRLQRLLGHLPALAHPRPRSVLIVGCGAGVTAGCFVDHPSIERIVICELEPQVPAGVRLHLADANRHVLDDPRTRVVMDDARHFLATSHETFDIITSDPVHPWVRGAAALYSSEYYRLVQAHLEPGGIVTQWVPLYETDVPSVKSQIATFARSFPGTTLWSSDVTGQGYDLVMMAQSTPRPIDVDAVEARIRAAAPVATALAAVQLGDAIRLLQTYAGSGTDLEPWLAGAESNRDVNLRLQYLAGLRLDVQESSFIFADMKLFRRYPADLFACAPATERELRRALGR
jgi:spermidine synthase